MKMVRHLIFSKAYEQFLFKVIGQFGRRIKMGICSFSLYLSDLSSFQVDSNNNFKILNRVRFAFNLLMLCFFPLFTLLNSQTLDTGKVFLNTLGLEHKGSIFFEVEGYAVWIESFKATFDEKGLKKIKKKYSINEHILAVDDSVFQSGKVLMETRKITKDVNRTIVYYLFPIELKKVKIIRLSTVIDRDTELEKFIVKSILYDSVPKNFFPPGEVDKINFVGRFIGFGALCHWRGLNKISCPNFDYLY